MKAKPNKPPAPLTPREWAVAQLSLAADKRAADILHISLWTLRAHRRSIAEKLGLHSKAAIGAWVHAPARVPARPDCGLVRSDDSAPRPGTLKSGHVNIIRTNCRTARSGLPSRFHSLPSGTPAHTHNHYGSVRTILACRPRRPSGHYIGWENLAPVTARRDMNVTTAGQGGDFVQTTISTPIIALLRNQCCAIRLGARY